MLGGGVAAFLGGELALLQLDVRGHLDAGVTVGQIEHRVVEGVETGQGDELEAVAHGGEFALELGDGLVVQVFLPVEGRRAVVREHLVREVLVHSVRELASELEVRGAGLHPDQIRIRRVRLGAGHAGLQAVADLVEAFGGALAGDELGILLVHIGSDEGGGLGVGAGDDQGGDVLDVSGQSGGVQGAYVLLGGNQNLAAQMAALLLGGQLVLPVHTGRTGVDHGLHQLKGVERATETGFRISHDGRHPVVDRADSLGVLDLIRTAQCVVDALDHLRHRVGGVQGLIRVGLSGLVGVTGNLPTREVNGLEAGLDLLNRLVTGQSAQSIDVILRVEQLPEPVCTAACEGVLLSKGTLQTQDLLGRVITGDAQPAGILVPVLLNFLGSALIAVHGVHNGLLRPCDTTAVR